MGIFDFWNHRTVLIGIDERGLEVYRAFCDIHQKYYIANPAGYEKVLHCPDCLEDRFGTHVPQERRTKQELRADILRVAQNGAGKTQIVYGAYLNFDIVKGHLAELIRTGRIVQRGKKFFTTESGLKYISYVEAIE